MLEVINVIAGEFEAGKLEEPGPADTVDPLANALVFPRIAFIRIYDFEHCVNHFGPARCRIRKKRNYEPGEAGSTAGIAHLAAHPDRESVVLRIAHWHRGAYAEAVAAVHALLFDDLDGLLAFHRGRPNCAGRTGSDERGDFAHPGKHVVLDLGWTTMNAKDCNVGAVDGSAHIQAAGHGNAQLGG